MIQKALFTFGFKGVANWALWLVFGCIGVWIIEGKSTDGFETSSLFVLAFFIIMALLSVWYNLSKEKK